MDYFERCQMIVAAAEGGDNFIIVNGKPVLKPKNRNDKGGPTRMGITQGTLRNAYSQGIARHDDITKLTKPEANAIYKANYWRPSRADKMQWGLCLVHYDCAVNCGVGGAAKQLQRALNELGQYVTVDGAIDPLSLAAISKVDLKELINAYLDIREEYYRNLAAKDESQKSFLNGWLRRLEDIRLEVV